MRDGALNGILDRDLPFPDAGGTLTVQVPKGASRDLRVAFRLAACVGTALLVLFGEPATACIDMRDMSISGDPLKEMDRYSAANLAEAREKVDASSDHYAWAVETRVSALIHMDRFEEAAALAAELLETHRTNPEPARLPLQLIRGHLQYALFYLGRTEESVEVLRSIIDVGGMRSFESYHHPCVEKLYGRLERLGRYGEAEALRREQLGLIARQGGEEFRTDPRAMKFFLRHVEPRLLSELASLVEKQGRYDEARRLHAEAVSRAKLIFGHGAPGWKPVMAFGRFLDEHGRGPEDAATLEKLKDEVPQLFRR